MSSSAGVGTAESGHLTPNRSPTSSSVLLVGISHTDPQRPFGHRDLRRHSNSQVHIDCSEKAACDAPCTGPTPPSGPASPRSATTSPPASPKPTAKAGPAKPQDSRSASPAPKTNSPRSTGAPAPPAQSDSECPPSA